MKKQSKAASKDPCITCGRELRPGTRHYCDKPYKSDAPACTQTAYDLAGRIHAILEEAWDEKITFKGAAHQIRKVIDDVPAPTPAATEAKARIYLKGGLKVAAVVCSKCGHE